MIPHVEQARGEAPPIDWDRVNAAVTAYEFFEAYHAKVLPCDGAYLDWASPDKRDHFKVFQNVRRPTLVLQSRSDFIVSHEARQVWERAAAAHEYMITCICSGGGHTTRSEGWCGSSLWMGRACHEFFESVIGMNSQSAKRPCNSTINHS